MMDMMNTNNSDKMNALMVVLRGSNDVASTRLVGRVLGTVRGNHGGADDEETKHERKHEHEEDSSDDEVEVVKDIRKSKQEDDSNKELKYLTTYYSDRTKDEGKEVMQDWTKHLFLKSALIPLECLIAGTQSRYVMKFLSLVMILGFTDHLYLSGTSVK